MGGRKRVTIGPRIPRRLRDELRHYSRRSGVPMNRIIEDAIRERLSKLHQRESRLEAVTEEAGP